MGFFDGLEKGWRAFEEQFDEATEGVGGCLGNGLPWLIVVAILIAVIFATCNGCG